MELNFNISSRPLNLLELRWNMPNRFLPVSVLIFLWMLQAQSCFSTITIHNIATTVSSCGNNGTATIQATSNKSNPFLLYEIIAGPSITPVQSNPDFSSLSPGTYTVRVYDVDFESFDGQFTISGNYQLPSPNLIAYTPTCVGSGDGMIIGNVAPLTGKAPFNWRIISPFTSPVQSSDTFKNLSAGSYMIRVEDACGNFQTRTIFIIDDGTGLTRINPPTVAKIGCDQFVLTAHYPLVKQKAKYPIRLILTTSSGTVVKRIKPIPVDTVNITPGLFMLVDTISGVNYGSYLDVCIEDTCGNRFCAPYPTIAPFDFVMQYHTGLTCGNNVSASIDLKRPPFYPFINTMYKTPVRMTLTDVATNTIVDSSYCTSEYCPILTKEHPSGGNYLLRIEDGCGQTFQQNIVWPMPGTAFVTVRNGKGCMDSTAYIDFDIYNFRSNVKLDIISGPAYIGSTKPKYAFNDVITYPKTFNVTATEFILKNAGIGTYQYRVYDDCGNSYSGTFTVQPSDVADFKYTYNTKKGCVGDNIFSFYAPASNIAGVYIKTLDALNTIYHKHYVFGPDSITSLPPGDYLFQVYYGYDPTFGGYVYNGSLSDQNMDCWLMEDTITIPHYSNSMFKTSSTISCSGNTYLQILVDSTGGVAPYLYEIVSGPQTFTPQSSNIFNISNHGNYIIRLQDACGNSSTRQISVDSVKFPPIVKKGPSCQGSKIVLSGISSPYFQYEWTTPGGTIHYGDSLVVSPLTVADTGLYLVKKIVTINGCTDVFNSSYRVFFHDEIIQTANLCHSSSIRVGNNIYTNPGVYIDSLINSRGCDSIITTTVLISYKRKHIDSTICEGNNVTIGTHTYEQTGVYKDTLIAANGCDSLITLSLTVIPYKRFSFYKTICQGQSFYFGGQARSMAGTYYDTLATTGCDSIVTLHLALEVPPVISLGKDTSICTGQTYSLNPGSGFAAYYWNNDFTDSTRQTFLAGTIGKYWVTIKTFAGCSATDTMQILTIYSLPVVSAGNDEYICSGEETTLSATSPTGILYHWNTGSGTSASILVRPVATTTYSVTVSDIHQCTSHPDEVTILVNPSPTTPPFNHSKITYCFDNGPLVLSAQGEKYFLWSNGTTTRSIDIKEQGIYSVTVSDDSGCFIKGEIFVKEYCAPEIYFPSAFSPNGDNLNEDLEIFGKHFRNFEIKIFNRWGEIIFISNDRNIRWNGMYKGEEMPVGTYECIIQYQGEYEEDTEEKTLQGSVTLIR